MEFKHFLEAYGAYRALKHLNKGRPLGMHPFGGMAMMGHGCHCARHMRRRHHLLRAATGVGSFAVGLAAGSLLGVLFAPMKGADARQELKENGVRGTVDKVKTKLEDEMEKAPC